MNNWKTYTVVVPPFVRSGETFPVLAGGNVVNVYCPPGIAEGSAVYFRIAENNVCTSPSCYVGEPTIVAAVSELPQETVDEAQTACLGIWLTFDIFAAIFFILTCALQPVLFQFLSDSCGAINPKTSAPIKNLMYDIFGGLGSGIPCSDGGNDFCIHWDNKDAWHLFDSKFRVMPGPSTVYIWSSMQIVVPFAVSLALLASCLHALALYGGVSRSTKAVIKFSGNMSIILAWICGVIATGYLNSSPASSRTAWSDFFNAGYNIESLLDPSVPPGPPLSTSCDVSVSYSNGGALLSTGIFFALLCAVFIAFSGCCPMYGRHSYYRSSYTLRRRRDHNTSIPAAATATTGTLADGRVSAIRTHAVEVVEGRHVSADMGAGEGGYTAVPSMVEDGARPAVQQTQQVHETREP